VAMDDDGMRGKRTDKGVEDPGKLDRWRQRGLEIGGLHTYISCALHVLRIIPYIVL
jgi:hypothetical protein